MLETGQARMLSREEFHTLLYTAPLAGEQYRTAQANFGLWDAVVLWHCSTIERNTLSESRSSTKSSHSTSGRTMLLRWRRMLSIW